MSRRRDDIEDDASGLVGKAVTGKFDQLDGVDCMEGARVLTGLTPVGQVVDPLLAGVQGSMEEERDIGRYRRRFGRDLKYYERRSPGFKRKMEELRGRWRGRMGEAVVSAGGALAGGAIGGSLAAGLTLTGPVGWAVGGAMGLGGLVGGGFLADKAYNAAFPRENQDMVTMVEAIDRLQREGQEVHPAMVLDVLVGNARARVGKAVEDRLEDETGVRQFTAAMSVPENKHKLDRLMRKTGQMAEAEKYAALLNSGEMKAKDLLDIPTYLLKREHQALLAGHPLDHGVVSPALPMTAGKPLHIA